MSPDVADAIQRLRERAAAAEKFAIWIENTTLLTPEEKRAAADNFLDGFDNAFADRFGPPDTRSRIERRNDAIRETVGRHYADLAPTTAAMAMADDLLAVDMRRSPRRKAARDELATILALNSGATLAWRRIHEIVQKKI